MSGVAVEDEQGRGEGRRHESSGRTPPGEALRVLVSFSSRYASYGEALFAGIKGARPGMRTYLVPFEEAGEAAARLRPHLIISDGAVVAPGAAKARVAAEPTEPSTMRVSGVVRTVVNPSFDDLLAFVDEVARAAGAGL